MPSLSIFFKLIIFLLVLCEIDKSVYKQAQWVYASE